MHRGIRANLRIDVQCHLFPRSFIKGLSSTGSQLRISPPDERGRRVVVDSKTGGEVTFFVDDSPFVDPKMHIRDMSDYGIDRQILSLPPPGVDMILDPQEALRLSMLINDELARVVETYPDKFGALATIPMNNATVALQEIERAINELGFKGIIVSSNTNAKFYDGDEYDEVFRTLERHNTPMFIHPTEPVTAKQIGQDYKLVLIFGWPFDTTLSIARLAFSGKLEMHPNLKIIAAHGGGMVPFFSGRIGMLAKVAAGGGKAISIDEPLKPLRNVYYDAALFDANALELLIQFAGVDHVVYASDYPFGRNQGRSCYDESLAMMERLRADNNAKEKIFAGNISRLLGRT
ncbi:MAG: amidohydrolase family protein [Thaumarchaeota archaeon]|nr:amidohydrolase family protein [Nitrososphaerota archaeon]